MLASPPSAVVQPNLNRTRHRLIRLEERGHVYFWRNSMPKADTIRTSPMTPVAWVCRHIGFMVRLPRLDLPSIPQHIVQRGNNRLPCFLDDADRQRYLHLLRDALLHTGSLLHAYVLMDNHVHLLLTPLDTGVTAQLMQKLGRQYVGQFKAKPQSRSLSGGN
ncbi:transposase [Burkholderia cepacia]|nr:transposase [Burkholderia cepacia]MBX3758593.1 transposase [Burkholderia cepacia]MBX3936080.1 transposase [Burkholderia cepacia]MBX3953767.1 transposase [Burkholderia cepacia]MBX3967154.1 transposase [Burkholderia cepacia]MBX3988140.1 transposase [Burkholderia cepacia]